MVVSTFIRRTSVVLPTPIRRAVRAALNRRANAAPMPISSSPKPIKRQSFLDDIDEMSNAVFGPLWKE
ncbi:MAG: hypothetical protein WCG75_07590 [Armatimonadota bacterium]